MTERDYRNAIRTNGKAKTHKSPTDFPEWLRVEIMKLGISQRQLANEIDVCETIVSRWFKRERRPTREQVKTLSKFMGISTDVIMGKI